MPVLISILLNVKSEDIHLLGNKYGQGHSFDKNQLTHIYI
jgi:hypothetical protein